MSDCLRDDQLERYRAQELPQREAEQVRTHLEACPACAKRNATHVQAERKLVDDLREIGSAGIAELDAPLAARGTSAEPSGSEARSRRGPAIAGYQIIGELHRGGQGAVYRAIQEHTKREVAVKVLLEGLYASPSARRRFEREIELAAQLRHPNIVTVFHSGVTPDGCQYCVMDYVRGLPLDEHVRRNELPLEDTLKLFAAVCDAVMYAHQRGIIHRDLKPSNIIVDAAGVPKVLDFGLAKQMFGPTDTFASLSGQVFGTLPYMSPEQTRGRPEEIDTRSDIYSLGMILYRLLTGSFPYPVDTQFVEAVQHIVETPPTPPSRVWTSAAGVVRRSARHTTTTKCPIGDEVQTIVLKALAKEPERRYQSALELANDIRRYIAGEPIAAKRTSHWYVLQKTVRRYKLRFAVAAAIVLLTAASTIALSIMYGKQTWLLKEVEDERNRAVAAEERAERRFGQVRELAHAFIFDFHDLIANLKGATPARELLVKTALEYLNGLASEAADDPGLMRELAIAYEKVADVQGSPAGANLGDTTGALQSYKAALRIFEMLAEGDPASAAARRELADCLDKLGNLHRVLNQEDEARACYERAVTTCEELAQRTPNDVETQRGLARAQTRIADMLELDGQTAKALDTYRQALTILQSLSAADNAGRRLMAICHGRIGDTLATMGRSAEALAAYQRAAEIDAASAEADPNNAEAQRDWANALDDVADMQRTLGDLEAALSTYQQGMRIREGLVAADPDDFESSFELAASYNRIGNLCVMTGQNAEALPNYQKGLEITQRLISANPDNERLQSRLRVSHITLGDARRNLKQLPEALGHYEQSLAIASAAAQADPESAQAQRDLAVSLLRVGTTQVKLGQTTEGLANCSESLAIREALAKAAPDNAWFQRNVAEVYCEFGNAHRTMSLDESLPTAALRENLETARRWYTSSRDKFIEMRDAGTLFAFDASMPDTLAGQITWCETAIAELDEQ